MSRHINYLGTKNTDLGSPDPSGLEPDTNPYRYSYNSPTNFTDPTGLVPEWVEDVGGWFGRRVDDVATIGEGFIGVPIEVGAILWDTGRTGVQGASLLTDKWFGTGVFQFELSSSTLGGYEQANREGWGGEYWWRTFRSNITVGLYDLGDAIIRGDREAALKQAGGMLWLGVPFLPKLRRGGRPPAPRPQAKPTVVDAAPAPAPGVKPFVADAAPIPRPGFKPFVADAAPLPARVRPNVRTTAQARARPAPNEINFREPGVPTSRPPVRPVPNEVNHRPPGSPPRVVPNEINHRPPGAPPRTVPGDPPQLFDPPLPTRFQRPGAGIQPPNPQARLFGPDLPPGEYVYVQAPNGQVVVVSQGSHLHPGVLGNGMPAAGAGEFTVGPRRIVTEVNNLSGTFKFSGKELPNVIRALEMQGGRVAPNAARPGLN